MNFCLQRPSICEAEPLPLAREDSISKSELKHTKKKKEEESTSGIADFVRFFFSTDMDLFGLTHSHLLGF